VCEGECQQPYIQERLVSSITPMTVISELPLAGWRNEYALKLNMNVIKCEHHC